MLRGLLVGARLALAIVTSVGAVQVATTGVASGGVDLNDFQGRHRVVETSEAKPQAPEPFDDFFRAARGAADVLVGRLGSMGAPYFYAGLSNNQRVALIKGGVSLARFVAEFGTSAFDEKAKYGPDLVWAHESLGLDTVDWAATHSPLEMALVARFGVKGAQALLAEFGERRLEQTRALRSEVADLYRNQAAFVPMVQRALHAGRFGELAGKLDDLARPVLLRIEKQDPYAKEGVARLSRIGQARSILEPLKSH